MEFNSYWTRDWMVIWTTSPGRLEESRWRKEQQAEIWAMAEWAWPEVVSLRYVRKFHFLFHYLTLSPGYGQALVEVPILQLSELDLGVGSGHKPGLFPNEPCSWIMETRLRGKNQSSRLFLPEFLIPSPQLPGQAICPVFQS